MSIVSVITISYNQAAFLERAIRSVIDQRGVGIQYIVVDPGSTDGSREILDSYRDRIDILLLDPDRGPADGLNKGLAVATGDYVAFLNADDELLPDALREAAGWLDAHPKVDAVMGSSWQIDERGTRVRRLVSSRRISAALCARGLAVVVQQSTFCRTAAVKAVGGFDPENRTCWDGDLFYRMARNGARFHRVRAIWAGFRIYAGSISGSGRFNERYAQEQRARFIGQFGHPPGARDRLTARLQYLAATLADPYGLAWKIASRIGITGGARRIAR